MLAKIKNRIERSLRGEITRIEKSHALKKISPLLYDSIASFLLREGKRIRPILFVLSYLGFAGRPAPNLFKGAVSLEFLHAFILIHDDIIDNAELRKGLPSLHRTLDERLKIRGGERFTGKELAMIIGDIIYAFGVETFLSIRVEARRKERALKKLTEAALLTGGGEFSELLYTTKDIGAITRDDIYNVYDLKTSSYTFSAPLVMGALLAGAGEAEVEKLSRYGLYLGKAFQIRDDMLDIFGNELTTGKGRYTDLREAKRTLILWAAYRLSSERDRRLMRATLDRKSLCRRDILTLRSLIIDSGARSYAAREAGRLYRKAKEIGASFKMRRTYRAALEAYVDTLIALEEPEEHKSPRPDQYQAEEDNARLDRM